MMPTSHPDPHAEQGPTPSVSFNKLEGFADFVGAQTEARDRDPQVSQIVLRYGQFNAWRTGLPTGVPKLGQVIIGSGHSIWAHSLEPALVQNDRVILVTWGTAQAVILGKLVIT